MVAFALVVFLCLLGWVPELQLALVTVSLVGTSLLVAGRWYAARLRVYKLTKHRLVGRPLVSIHIPTYCEPPELVIQTLHSVLQLEYEHFEVIILDNNTPDATVWQPVADYCEQLGDSRVRFYHYDKVKGYKAGALNLCYELMSPAAEYILVIDADYRVAPELLDVALPHFGRPKVGLVQFPQAYLNVGRGNRAVQAEFEHFFGVYMNLANHLDCVLSTGTVSLIRCAALEAANLWYGKSITEDVDLGLRLHRAGYTGVYVPQALGKGLMPSDLASIRVQRERWVYGNMQSLLHFCKSHKCLSLQQAGGVLLMLTAWFNPLLVPVLLLVVAGIASWVVPASGVPVLVAQLCLANIAFYLVGQWTILYTGTHYRPRVATRTLLVHMGLAYEGALHWWRVFLYDGMAFKRTNKFRLPANAQGFGGGLTLGLLVALGTVLALSGSSALLLVGLAVALLFVSATFYLHHQLGAAHRYAQAYYEVPTSLVKATHSTYTSTLSI